MRSLVILTGRLGAAPETREVGDTTVTSFSLATDTGWGDNKKTMWSRINVWGAQGQACQKYLNKGSILLVEGEPVVADDGGPRTYTNNEGEVKATYEVRASKTVFIQTVPKEGDPPF